MLLGTDVAREAAALFAHRAQGDPRIEIRLTTLKMVTPYYQHVEGTSFAAPIVASAVACMLQANPALTPRLVREILITTAQPVAGASTERQGAGVLEAGSALSLALREQHSPLAGYALSPQLTSTEITFLLHDHTAQRVAVLGSWDHWSTPGLAAVQVEPGIWQVKGLPLPPGSYVYKFLLDGAHWLDDPANPYKEPDSFGGLNSLLVIPN